MPIEDFQTVLIDCINSCLKTINSPKSSNDLEDLLTIDQASEFLKLSVNTIYTHTRQATIPFCKKGKRLYFTKIELLEWVKSGRKKTTTEIKAEADTFLSNNKKK